MGCIIKPFNTQAKKCRREFLTRILITCLQQTKLMHILGVTETRLDIFVKILLSMQIEGTDNSATCDSSMSETDNITSQKIKMSLISICLW